MDVQGLHQWIERLRQVRAELELCAEASPADLPGRARTLAQEMGWAMSGLEKTASSLGEAGAQQAQGKTEKKREERTLRQSEESALQVLENTSAGVLVVDSQGRITFANAAVERMFGYSRDELVGQPVEVLVPETARAVHAEHRGRYNVNPWVRSMGQGMVLAGQRKDGTVFPAEISLSSFSTDQGVLTNAFVVDISKRVEVEQGLKRQARQHILVAELGQAVFQGMSAGDLVQDGARRAASGVEAELSAVFFASPDGRELVLHAGTGWEPRYLGNVTLKVDAKSQSGYTLLSRAPVLVEDMATETRFELAAVGKEHNIRSGITVVLGNPERPLGVLGTFSTRPRAFTPDDVNFLQSVGSILGSVVERERTQDAIRELSAPVLPVGEHLLILPLVGVVDSERSRIVMGNLLASVRTHRARAVVIDLSGVPFLDVEVVRSLVRTAEAVWLMGARVVFTGISSAFSKALVSSGEDLGSIITRGDLRSGIEEAERVLAVGVAPRGGSAVR